MFLGRGRRWYKEGVFVLYWFGKLIRGVYFILVLFVNLLFSGLFEKVLIG